MRGTPLRCATALAAAVLLLVGPASPGSAAPPADTGRTCRESTVPVSVQVPFFVPGKGPAATNTLTDQPIHVRFCQPKSGPSSTVQVLVHGITYDHRYWNVITNWFAASDNPEVDALLLTAATHNIREVGTPYLIVAPLYPAELDPAYAGAGLDPGYLTDRPGTRYETYYAPDTNVDRRVLEADEATKGTVTAAELNNYSLFFRTRLNIAAPVFLLIGSADAVFCSLERGDLGAPCSDEDDLVSNEQPWLGPNVPSIDAHIVDGAGHALNAVRSSTETFAAAHSWLKRTLRPR